MHLIKTLFVIVTAVLFPVLTWSAPSEQSIKDRMKIDLDIIRNAFDVQYDMKEWKYSYSGWDLDQEINKAKENIQNTSPISLKAYQQIVRDFFNSTKDYHVSVRFYSTETTALPFRVHG